jgi:alanyl-tRNA synthetase
MRSAAQIRSEFIEYFLQSAHTHVPSSPVVPFDDPTLMFTNAGMNQFKDVFLGTGTRAYTRAANSQKCIRAGGKHNDLDDVGHDTYHHTFFEMLGNWSFGDYFKEESIRMAWTLLTDKWGLDKSRLHATVFGGGDGVDRDDEAADLWRSITDINPDHVHFFGKNDNFWEMGETGPCGPCSEIHIDLTPDRSGAKLVNADDPRVMEIWNLVFIQYNRDETKALTPLPDQHVDTGMGFERVTAVIQGKTSNYDTDVFTPLFEAIRAATNAPAYGRRMEQPGVTDPEVMVDVAYRVVADHLRCLTVAISDGADLSNEGRGFVLRRILRRAVRYGRQYLGVTAPFLHGLVPAVVQTMGDAFPELQQRPDEIAEVLHDEEVSFDRTYERGVKLFEQAAQTAGSGGRISGEEAFKLHGTFGFPVDLTKIMASERGLTVDTIGYDTLMEEEKTRARQARSAAADFDLNIANPLPSTDDSAKFCDDAVSTNMLGFVRSGRLITDATIPADTTVGVLLEQTGFYGEQGGQVGDTGRITSPEGEFIVDQTRRHGDTVLHIGRCASGDIKPGGAVVAEVDRDRRITIVQNHSATHVMNWALRDVLGDHVDQKGSLVDEEKTRFDFAHPKAVGPDELERIEQSVNRQIEQNLRVHTAVVDEADARKINTLRAVFGEKYPPRVRVVSIGQDVETLLANPDDPRWMELSVEFCGGTHVVSTSQIERFCILEESGVARGIRRVVAVTGETARHCVLLGDELQREIEQLSGVGDAELAERLSTLTHRVNVESLSVALKARLRDQLKEQTERARKHEKSQAQAGGKAVRECAEQLLAQSQVIGDSRVIVGSVPSAGPDQIREALDLLRDQAGSAGILLGCPVGPKVLLFAAFTDDLVARGLKAGDLIRETAPIVGGGGGGKPQLAQAGGKNPDALPEAIEHARRWIVDRLGG